MGMRTAHDPFGSPAVLTDQMIGNSYDIVRHVAVNMEYVKHVSAHLPDIYVVSKALADINAAVGLVGKIAELELRIAALEAK